MWDERYFEKWAEMCLEESKKTSQVTMDSSLNCISLRILCTLSAFCAQKIEFIFVKKIAKKCWFYLSHTNSKFWVSISINNKLSLSLINNENYVSVSHIDNKLYVYLSHANKKRCVYISYKQQTLCFSISCKEKKRLCLSIS